MERIRKCIYCNEVMTYGLHSQIMSNPGENNFVKFQLVGWRCPMKNDNCDIIFDLKDTDINNKNRLNAENKLRTISCVKNHD